MDVITLVPCVLNTVQNQIEACVCLRVGKTISKVKILRMTLILSYNDADTMTYSKNQICKEKYFYPSYRYLNN